MQVFLSATLSRLDCAQGDSHVPTEAQNSFPRADC